MTNARIIKFKGTNEYECANVLIRLFVVIRQKIVLMIRPFVKISVSACGGFGLLEVLISVGILALVTGGVVGLGNISVKNSVISSDRTVAYNLAQEGKEALKQIRDTKWVDQNINSWNKDFTDASGVLLAGDWQLQLNLSTKEYTLVPGTENIDKNNTTYTRKITFSTPDPSANSNLTVNNIDNTTQPANSWMIKAIVNVSWDEYDRPWSVGIPVYFTDWLPL